MGWAYTRTVARPVESRRVYRMPSERRRGTGFQLRPCVRARRDGASAALVAANQSNIDAL